jgi:LPXTG-site transpeptidase (sortase) family protein
MNGDVAHLSVEKETNSSLPLRLKIPSINVDAQVEYVGLNKEGAMDVPKEPDAVAWFNIGPRPGELGSSVIAGHSGYKDNKPAVFDNLYKLKKGGRISVEDATGKITNFIVRETRNYKPNADATNIFNSNDNTAHLNLITCVGDWNEENKTHSLRLIVFTDKE